jgi:hypothetical protein
MYHLENMIAVVEACSLAPLTRILGLSNESARVLIAGARGDLRDPKSHFYTAQHFVYGRKPVTKV